MSIQAALVRSILEQYRSFQWTVQGFGFARTKIADVGRIHVWDARLAVPLVSTMHTHPWALRSTIISGELINQRFVVSDDGIGLPYMHSLLKTGEGGGLIGEPEAIRVKSRAPELYNAGRTYKQEPAEIHRTVAQDGTVTLLERQQGLPLEEASVFWPCGGSWVSAEPKPAEDWQLIPIIQYALKRWAPDVRLPMSEDGSPNG